LENWPTSEPKKTGLFCFSIFMATDFMVERVVLTYATPFPSETNHQHEFNISKGAGIGWGGGVPFLRRSTV
jgi:hypothetical protein